jgi:hypothetical protein
MNIWPHEINYVLGKFIGYTIWCGVGVAIGNNRWRNIAMGGLGYGGIRLLLGFILGTLAAVPYASLMLGNQRLGYLLIFIPMRIFEWSLMAKLIKKREGITVSRSWIIGGIVVSFVIDALFGIIPQWGISTVGGRVLC